MNNCKSFFDSYAKKFSIDSAVNVIDIGSQDVNGSLREVCPANFNYIGLDFQNARGVDIVLTDPYSLPLEDNSVDIVLSSSCFEHSEMFWLVYLEIMRVLKPHGLFYLNAPSSGTFHRYPVDCWRFYPDSGLALVKWANRNGHNAGLLESYIQHGGIFQDFVSVYIKDVNFSSLYPDRILHAKKDFENGQLLNSPDLYNPVELTQHERRLHSIGHTAKYD